jgi:hypothetical protein
MPSRDPLEDMSVDQVVTKLKGQLHTAINQHWSANTDSADLTAQLNKSVGAYLDTIKDDGQIRSHTVESKEVFHTWKSMYPNRTTRLLVRAFFIFGGRQRYRLQRWFHTVLPFEITYGVSTEHITDNAVEYEALTEEDYLKVFDDIGWLEANRQTYFAELKRPYSELVTDITYTPIMPIHTLSVNFSITPDGANFGELNENN